MNKNKKILFIGGEGYIGNIVVQNMLSNDYIVTSYDNLVYGNNQCVLNKLHVENYSFVFGDMLDIKKLENEITKSDAVVLLAGLVGDPITKKYPYESSLINDQGVKNVIDLCSKKNIKNFVFVSTCSNYGLIENNDLADEEYELNPLSLYAKSKVRAEKYILSLQGRTGMHPTILRFATAFGLSPRMRFDLTVSEFTHDLAMGKELLVYDAHTWRPYCHVQDFSRLIQMVLEAPTDQVSFQVFNAGSENNNYTKQGIVEKILKYLPESKVKYKDHGGDPRSYKVSFEKVSSVLGFNPIYSITDGIDELLEAIDNHVFEQVDKNKNLFGNYEITYRKFK